MRSFEGFTSKVILPGLPRRLQKRSKRRGQRSPEYEEWFAIDQQVLAFLLLSLSKEIVAQVAVCTMMASSWGVIEDMYALGTRARTQHLHLSRHDEEREQLYYRIHWQGLHPC
jgi:hypothetical protein